MARELTYLDVFISSTEDVASERELVARAIEALNPKLDMLGVRLCSNALPSGLYPGINQDVRAEINRQIMNHCDIFVGILGNRFGSATHDAGSGSEEQFTEAISRLVSDTTSVRALFYFKTMTQDVFKLDIDQLVKVTNFREGLKGHTYQDFSDSDQFFRLVEGELWRLIKEEWCGNKWRNISRMIPSTAKVRVEQGAQGTVLDSILIVTVTKVEAQAVLEIFQNTTRKTWTRQIIGDKTYYNLGILGRVPVFMVQSEMGIATPGGALLTVRQAIQDLHPQAVIMCGVAFGLHPDRQQLGDIMVAKQIQYYEPQKMDLERGQMSRGDRVTSSERLLDRFRSGDNDWHGAQTQFGLVLSGEKLVNDSDLRDRLLKIEPEAIGGEMEGAGLYAAARHAKVDWILVKAICDWAEGKKNNDAQPLAAQNAAQFVLHVLKLSDWSDSPQ